MKKDKKQDDKKNQKNKKSNLKISGLDIDKQEYREIVLSNSNFPERGFY